LLGSRLGNEFIGELQSSGWPWRTQNNDHWWKSLNGQRIWILLRFNQLSFPFQRSEHLCRATQCKQLFQSWKTFAN
jgi:hypothetical protein